MQGTGKARRIRAAMVCVLLCGLVQSLAVGAADPMTAQTPVTRAEPRVGRTNPQKTVSLAVSLKVDDRALDAFLANIYDPASPEYRRYLTPDQFTARFVSRSDRAQVADYLRGRGLTVKDSSKGVLLDVTGSAEQVERAFNVTFSDHRGANGRIFHAADRTPALPMSVAAKVADISGAGGARTVVPRYVRPPVQPAQPGQRGASGSRRAQAATGCAAARYVADNIGSISFSSFAAYTPNQIATAYNFDYFYDRGFRGEGQSVALFELSPFDPLNVAAYQSCFGTSVNVVDKPVDGGAYFDLDIAVEVDLDIDVIIGLAPKLANLYVYNSSEEGVITDATFLRQYQAIANDNLAPIVSTSYGYCELDVRAGYRETENAIFRQMAAQGQSFYNAIGDTGSANCLPGSGIPGPVADDIGSMEWVTSVGGTQLLLDPTTNQRTAETVWNEYPDRYATGGGISRYWPRPAWQTGPGVDNPFSNGKRQSPDVAANADPRTGYIVYTNYSGTCPRFEDPGVPNQDPDNCFIPIGGTSAGAPLYAAATALMNQYFADKGKGRLGFANPALYSVFRATPPTSMKPTFFDVVGGDNCVNDSCVRDGGTPGDGTGLYPATVGYDMATGVGVADFGLLAQRIVETNTLAITALSPSSGPTTGGTTVEISGTGFVTGMTLTLGGQQIAYQVINPTMIRIITPAHATGAVEIQIRTPMGEYLAGAKNFLYVNPMPVALATVPPPTAAMPSGIGTSTPTPPRPAPQPVLRQTAPPPTRAGAVAASEGGASGTATPLPAPVRR